MLKWIDLVGDGAASFGGDIWLDNLVLAFFCGLSIYMLSMLRMYNILDRISFYARLCKFYWIFKLVFFVELYSLRFCFLIECVIKLIVNSCIDYVVCVDVINSVFVDYIFGFVLNFYVGG